VGQQVEEKSREMPNRGIALLLCACLLSAGAAHAQDAMSERLSNDKIGAIATGTYNAGKARFTLDSYGDKYLLRLAGDPEVYVLYADHASLGGRVLKYDYGAVVIQVAGWGGVTLYTDAEPGGAPAERVADTLPPSLSAISLGDMQNAAEDESAHLAYARGVRLGFTTDWNTLGGDSVLRAQAFDAMENAGRGLDRFAASAPARAALSQKIDTVRIDIGGRPTIALSGKTLIVTFNPQRGYAGRASSRAIAHALGTLFGLPQAN
jgi:hypothetical protein